ncbi:MAG: hypothetical protein WBD47_01890 [Phormidesmis sp.]
MKRIALSLISAALLSVAVVPMAKAATYNNPHRAGIRPNILTPAQTTPTDVEPSAQAHPIPALEQARLNRLDRVANTPGSLNRQQAAPENDLDPHNLASVSPLQQMRLDHLNTSN